MADDLKTPSPLPLAGLRVLDLSRILAGPVCCQVLADLGADVVKVERPGTGDDTRAWGPPFLPDGGPSAYYLSANRGKRSLAIDLEHPQAAPLLAELIRTADALVENFLPRVRDKLGLAPERLAALNPRLVSCAISGYGRTGPLADVPGYDLVVQATSGLMSITGEPDGPPLKVGVAITDIITGLYAATSILAGLVARERGAAGKAFDLALADCTLASLVNVVQGALVTGERPRRYGNAHPHIVPYEVFATADGHLVLAVGNDRQFQRFCAAAGESALAADPQYATNAARVAQREKLVARLRTIIAARTTANWLGALAAAEVPHAPVLAVDEALAAPQTAAREMLVEVTDSAGRNFRLVGSPIHWQGEPPRTAAPPPELGADTDQVLRDWLGYSQAQRDELRAAGALG
ncbi:MAG: CoA transferase [Planctomycetaceae bacterium]|nr:CoA transferase [Planctomycetaceae bacterium]